MAAPALGPSTCPRPSGYLPHQWSLDEARYACSTKSMASPSYPGLVTRYTLHRAPARVPGLPRGPFRTEEQRRGGLLVTLWEWAPAHELADAL